MERKCKNCEQFKQEIKMRPLLPLGVGYCTADRFMNDAMGDVQTENRSDCGYFTPKVEVV
jgi:hypothetical protein